MSERVSTIVGTFDAGLDILVIPPEALAQASAILDEARRQREAEAAAEARAAVEREAARPKGWRGWLGAFWRRRRWR